MMKSKIILSVVLIFMLSSKMYIVEGYDNVNFKNITIENGLSQSTVETLYQDSKGYIWIGTNDGLDRYNGYEFKKYKKDRTKENSLVGNYIIDITEDTKGNIWVGTTSGLSKIDLYEDTITNYTSNNSNLSNDNICEILVTKDGSILVATDDGINLYNEEKNSFTRILYKDNILTSQSIYSIAQDEFGHLWVGTDEGLNKVDVNKKTVEKIYATNEDNSISDNFIYKIYCDNKGYAWVGTYQGGLNKINLKTNEITIYKNEENDNSSIAGDFIRNILRTRSGQIWVCTSNGISKYIEEEDNFINYRNVTYDRYSILDNNTFSIIEDRNGVILVGTYKGISMFDPNNAIEHYKNDPFDNNSLSDNTVHGIYEDDNGLLWVGSNSKGLNIINRETEEIKHITKEDGLSSDVINAIAGDKNIVWVGTNNGLNKINTQNNTIEVFDEELNALSGRIKSLYLDSKGYLWIGKSNGIYILNTKTEQITDITYILENNNITDTYIETIYEDSEGNYWIGTFVEGYLIKIDVKNNSMYNYKSNIDTSSIRSIVDGTNNVLWIGTSDGLVKMDKKNEKFTLFTENEGLTNNNIYGILIDEYGNPWMSTNNGISKFDLSKDKFINYYLEDGLQSNEFNGSAYYKNSSGEFLFGGINGLNIFNHNNLNTQDNIDSVIIDEFTIKGEKYKDINNIELDYYNNRIGIKFFLPNYKNNSNVQYQYKIEGKDENWNYTTNNEVIYNNLSPGRYEFKVKARNHNGTTSEESSVVFKVKPPIWLSIQAFVIYILGAIYIIYLNRSKMKRLDKLVNKRTRELNDEMDKNKELFDRVIKLEKNKNNYFVNLSHELRTPLNVISTTEQLITELNKKDNGISKEKLNYHMGVMKKNTRRLLNLINNIIDTNKVEHGNYSLNIKEYDIVFIVEEISLSMKDYIESKGIELIIDPEVEEKIIECDKDEIERCIVNLISNARKFTLSGGTIEVGLKDLGDKVEITVKDSGIGIDLKNHSYIFDRFNQIVDENSEVKGGSGLGLTITKHIIELHGGKICVESKVDKGSIFKIILNTKYNDIVNN